MPPANKKQFKEEERAEVLEFIESKIFKINQENPDPGRGTIRRLNREEYRNTVIQHLKMLEEDCQKPVINKVAGATRRGENVCLLQCSHGPNWSILRKL